MIIFHSLIHTFINSFLLANKQRQNIAKWDKRWWDIVASYCCGCDYLLSCCIWMVDFRCFLYSLYLYSQLSRLRNVLYCVGWGVKLYSIQCTHCRCCVLYFVRHCSLSVSYIKDDDDDDDVRSVGWLFRSVGGLRASLYNAVTLEDTKQLARFMQDFQINNSNWRHTYVHTLTETDTQTDTDRPVATGA